jgi:Fic family protein
MNKRIKELANEAGLPTYNPDGIPTKLEKFAESIIKECYDVVMTGDRYRRDYFADKIKKHFGMDGE